VSHENTFTQYIPIEHHGFLLRVMELIHGNPGILVL